MNYSGLSANQRDALTAIVALDAQDTVASAKAVHRHFEAHFGPISYDGFTANVLSGLVEQSLALKERSESDGRVWVYRPTDTGHEAVHQALRERLRWILPPEPTPDHADQTTLMEVLEA